jgi:hypothetical protein
MGGGPPPLEAMSVFLASRFEEGHQPCFRTSVLPCDTKSTSCTQLARGWKDAARVLPVPNPTASWWLSWLRLLLIFRSKRRGWKFLAGSRQNF